MRAKDRQHESPDGGDEGRDVGRDVDRADQDVAADDVRAFVVASRDSLYRTAFLLVGDRHDAEDLLQSTLVRVIEAWPRIRRRDAPEVYARRVMVNVASSRWRRLKRYGELIRRDPRVDNEPDPASGVAVRDAVWTALESLPPRMRAVLVLRFFEDFSEADTAQVLDCSPGTVKSQTSRALSRLRERLDPHDLNLMASPMPESPGSTTPRSTTPRPTALPRAVHLHETVKRSPT